VVIACLFLKLSKADISEIRKIVKPRMQRMDQGRF
jgi:hypothetical protein